MTEIGESVAVVIDSSGAEGAPCWYCKEEPEDEDAECDVEADPDTSDSNDAENVPENDVKNSAAKLAVSLGKVKGTEEPQWHITTPEREDASRVVPGAHHCLPGGASLGKTTKLINLIKKGIPYSVNHRNNGVWLPGNYAVRPGSEGWTKKWSGCGDDFKNNYAFEAMQTAGTQFHDAHPAYNAKVRKALDALVAKIGDPVNQCPICKKKLDAERLPYGLVGRLDALSAAHRALLTGVSKTNEIMKKAVENDYYTSSRVKTFFGV